AGSLRGRVAWGLVPAGAGDVEAPLHTQVHERIETRSLDGLGAIPEEQIEIGAQDWRERDVALHPDIEPRGHTEQLQAVQELIVTLREPMMQHAIADPGSRPGVEASERIEVVRGVETARRAV